MAELAVRLAALFVWCAGVGCGERARPSGTDATATAATATATAAVTATATAATATATATAGATVTATATATATAGATATATAKSSEAPPAFLSAAPYESEEELDVWLEGGTVVDGSGSASAVGDVLIDDGRIVHVGRVARATAKKRIDARGHVVTPGFIDAHSHGDPLGPSENFLAMGVTTLCVGQDGESPSGDRIRTFASRLRKKKLAVNVAPFVGHATLRALAKIGGDPQPSEQQLARMKKLLASELEDGAFGLSTGLEYHPGSVAPPGELVALAEPLAKADALVMSHLRSEDADAIDAALDELLLQANAGARVHVAHAKIVYGKGEAAATALLRKLDAARARGVSITLDAYPYDASYTTIGIVFPEYAKGKNPWPKVKRQRRDELAAFLRERVGKRGGPSATLFGTGPWRGDTLADVATRAKKPFEDVLIDDVGPNGASAAFFVMDPVVQTRLLLDPFVMVGTDGGSQSRHPRGHGTFAKVLRELVHEKQLLSLPEAVRKMSHLPAETLRLAARGKLEAGAAADVLVFDPANVRDRATYAEPSLRAQGMRWVFVNGRAAIADGALTKARGGRLLLRTTSPR